jgi:hypothetical protein
MEKEHNKTNEILEKYEREVILLISESLTISLNILTSESPTTPALRP